MILPCAVALMLLQAAQEPKPPGPQAAPAPGFGVRYDAHTGWPMVPDAARRPVEDVPGWPTEPPHPTGAAVPGPVPVTGPRPAAPSAPSAAEPVSLSRVFQAIGAPAGLRALGGVTVWWRLSVHGSQGEAIAHRELTHHADLAHAERDRLEYADGRVYGRDGLAVFAERHGMPWPTLAESASQELALFGLLLRMPWVFGEPTRFALLGSDPVARDKGQLLRFRIERRSDTPSEAIGPDPVPRPRDRFELLCDPASLQPRELVYRLAGSNQSRRMRLEDWRDVGGVPLPFRRILVDAEGRTTTALEIQRVEHLRAIPESFFRVR